MIRLKSTDHLKYPWVVHDILNDFRIEDVWQVPVELNSEHTLSLFRENMNEALADFTKSGFSGLLFRIRFFIGEIFGWDDQPPSIKEDDNSIRARYAKHKNLTLDQLPPLEGKDFEPVYILSNEFLAEIQNDTVHAALHLGKVPTSADKSTIHLTVYVKPKGILGNIYMWLIKLPRHLIVYPAMLRAIGKKWTSSQIPAQN